MTQLPKLLNAGNGFAEIRRIRPISVSVDERIVPLSTATIQMTKDELGTGAEEIRERSWVEVFTPNGSAGYYRTRTPENGYGSDETVTVGLEHGICELGDWIITENIEQKRGKLVAAINEIMSYYSGTGRGSLWQYGGIDSQSLNGYVVYAFNHTNILEALLNVVGQIPNAMMAFNFSTTPWSFRIRARQTSVSAEGRLGRNIESARIKRDDSKLCTRVYVEGLTSPGYAESNVATYGIAEKYLSGSYTTEQAETVAGHYLAAYDHPRISIQISGADLFHSTGVTWDKFELGKLFRLAIEGESSPTEENIIGISWPDVYEKEGLCTVSLAEEEETQITFLKAQESRIDGAYSYTETLNQQTNETINLVSTKTDENGNILAKAGLSLDATTGAIIYAENQEIGDDFIWSKTKAEVAVQADRINLVVTGEGVNKEINTASIVVAINGQADTPQSMIQLSADVIEMSGSVVVSQSLHGYLDGLTTGTLWADALAGQEVWTWGLYCRGYLYLGTNCDMRGELQQVSIGGQPYNILVFDQVTSA